MKTILIILGTRPEVIKLASVIIELKNNVNYRVLVCNTEQQKELSNQTLGFFNINADFNLNVMSKNQTLAGVQSCILDKLSDVYKKNVVDATIVQGDTMTAFCGSLISFYNHIPIFHVEAGLRSYNLFEPFPEEAIRQMISRISDLNFVPTILAKKFLLKENIKSDKIFVTGNSVIDALFSLPDNTLKKAIQELKNKNILLNDNLVLITLHRRENHGERLDKILSAIDFLRKKFSEHKFIIPVHPNPNVCNKIHKKLDNIDNVILTPPMDYPELVCIMKNAKLIITDSGGIQEEAPTFGVPVLITRYETERKEGVKKGFAKLVGADKDIIIKESINILEKQRYKKVFNKKSNPYGDGQTSKKITRILNEYWEKKY